MTLARMFTKPALIALAAVTLGGCNRGLDLNAMTATEQTHYIARCAALVMTTGSLAEAQGNTVESRQLYAASQHLMQAAVGPVTLDRMRELTLDYVTDRREDVVAGRMSFQQLGQQALDCIRAIEQAGLV